MLLLAALELVEWGRQVAFAVVRRNRDDLVALAQLLGQLECAVDVGPAGDAWQEAFIAGDFAGSLEGFSA